MAAEDILFNGDIAIKDGDLDIGPSDQQHIEHIFQAGPGQFFQFPTLGINITKDLLGPTHAAEKDQKVRENLIADNYRVDNVKIEDNIVISVEATRKA